MMTWAERKETRELWRKIRTLKLPDRADPSQTNAKITEGISDYILGRRPLEYRLWEIETGELLRSANRLSIDANPSYDDEGLAYGRCYLSRSDRAALRRAIRNERRKAGQFWIAVLMPPLSLLVALASVLNSCG